MSEDISAMDKRTFQNIMKDLEAYSLLEENESVAKGFFPIIAYKFYTPWECRYNGLLTQKKLILIRKKSFSKPSRAEIIPFENFKEIFQVKVRILFNLLLAIGALGCIPWFSFFILSVIRIMGVSIIEFLNGIVLILIVIIGILCIVLAIISINLIHEFIRGMDVIFLALLGENILLRYSISWGGMKFEWTITLLKFLGEEKNIQAKKAKLGDLYDILNGFTNCKGFRDDSIHYIAWYFPLNKLKEKIYQWQSKILK